MFFAKLDERGASRDEIFNLFSVTLVAQPTATPGLENDSSLWHTFTNKAGWMIKYPISWRVSSCRQCSDPTDPNVDVTLYNASTKQLIAIEHLLDKPSDQTAEQCDSHSDCS